MVGSRPDARSDYVSRHFHRHTRACPAHPRLWALCRDRLELAWSERRLPATQQGRYEKRPRARSSAEEHYLDMVGVTGSIPVAPTIKRRFLFLFWKRPRADLFQFFSIQ